MPCDKWGRQDPEPVRQARIAEVAREMMDAYNHGKTDPSDMAVNGHDTDRGYVFFIERGGRTFRFTAELDE